MMLWHEWVFRIPGIDRLLHYILSALPKLVIAISRVIPRGGATLVDLRASYARHPPSLLRVRFFNTIGGKPSLAQAT